MFSRIGVALIVCLSVVAPATAQVVRFQTTMGDFDMVLNPRNDPRLQEHVDNMLTYVEEGRYKGVWINRAAEDFVLQMGGFYANTRRPSLTIDSVRSVDTFAPTTGVPASTISGLSNTSGTVALALPGLPTGGTNRNAGTSSFFVNLGSNTFLDADFTVFAAIPDLTVINEIMALTQVDRTTDPLFGADPGNLAFSDVPVQEDGFQVFIERAFVVSDTLEATRARAGVASTMEASAAAFNAQSGAQSAANVSTGSAGGTAAGMAVPEPTSVAMGSIGLLSFLGLSARRRR